jgi:hypothetical protein
MLNLYALRVKFITDKIYIIRDDVDIAYCLRRIQALLNYVRFYLLMAVNMKSTVFQNVMLYHVAKMYRHFRENIFMEAADSSKTLVPIYHMSYTKR